MNEILQRKIRPTTQAAAGVPRLRWTLAEFERLAELGIFTEKDHIELVGGELVPMAPKTVRHENMRSELFNRELPEACKRAIPSLPPNEVLLAIEVADLSIEYDTTLKARLYAAFGVRDYWVINAVSLVTLVHRRPSAAGYAELKAVAANDSLRALLIPSLTARLGDPRLE